MEINYKNYQESEFGLIPKEWEVKEIDHFIDLLTGFPFPSQGYSNSGIKLLRGSNIKRGNIDWNQEITEYWPSLTPELREYILLDGDIVISMDGSLVGRSFARLTKNDLPALLLQRVARIRSSKIDMGYLKEFICSSYFTKYCDSVKTSSAIPHISPKDIKDFRIPIPPKITEQTAIATALFDMDALIAQTEKLIEKKKAIKQGVMQELLRPKEGWLNKKLGDFGKTYGGITGKGKADFGFGGSRYIPFMNIMANPVIDIEHFDVVNINSGEFQNKVQCGDLFFNGSSETPEEVGLCSVLDKDVNDLYLNSFCFGYRMNNANDFNGYFLAYLFRSPLGRKLIYSLAQGATRYNLSKTSLMKLELPIPNKKEQDSIANIIIDIDNEISIQNKKLQKLKLEKQGMMQALLTGKIRLV